MYQKDFFFSSKSDRSKSQLLCFLQFAETFAKLNKFLTKHKSVIYARRLHCTKSVSMNRSKTFAGKWLT